MRYDLTITQHPVNLSGKKTVDFALMVNGQIPSPTLEFTEGDDAEIHVTNGLASGEEVSVHWHGLLLPPEEDGVAYVNTPPIHKGQSRTFKFKIRQHGTYWYHSHTMLQEQKGVYGAFVIHPKKKTVVADKDIAVVLSDWTDENPDQVLKNLKKDGDYYLHKKDSVRSYWGALKAGGLGATFMNEWSRMGGMDLSDVGYDAFLMNGKRSSQLAELKAGQRVRLRVINAGASSYFYLSLGDLPMTVISADGTDIKPVTSTEILMGMAETYDILFTVPENKNYELRATAQDVTGQASGWLGQKDGDKVYTTNKPYPKMYEGMDHSAHHGQHAAPTAAATLGVDDIQSPTKTQFPESTKVTEVKLVLGGDMERYVWHINGKAIHEDRTLLINEGQVIRYTFVNETMMHHPMHLHGHFFRVVNKHGEYSPLKHTVDVPPHGTRTIEFLANEPGQWMLHCHNLYHMKTGMARVVKYSAWSPRPEMAAIEKKDPHLHDHIYTYGQLAAFSNLGELQLRLSQTRNQVDLRLEGKDDDDWEIEGDLFLRRWVSQYANLVVGGSRAGEDTRAMIGAHYLLPLLIESQVLIDENGELRVDLEKKFQWTKHIYSEVEWIWRQDPELESEYALSLMYARAWHWSAGLKFTGYSLGAGLEYRF